MTHFHCTIEQLPWCCGATEGGDLFTTDRDGHSNFLIGSTLVDRLLSRSEQRPIFFNFVQNYDVDNGFEDEYVCQEVLDLLLADRRCVDLGTWINPNSDNRIHGLMIKGGTHE